MRDDPIQLLERELTVAAQRLHNRRTGHDADAGPRRWRPSLSWLGAAALLAVAIAVAAGAVLLTRHDRAPRTPASPTVKGREQLISILGVLRRQQTQADLAAPQLRTFTGDPLFALRGTPDLPLVRLATTTSWGERIFLVPLKPPPAAELRALTRRARMPLRYGERLRARGETLGVFSADGAAAGMSAQDIEAGRSWSGGGQGLLGARAPSRLVVVVPDGVAWVAFVVPPAASRTGRILATVVATVRGNVAAIQVSHACCDRGTPMVWYAADGHVITRIGDFTAPTG